MSGPAAESVHLLISVLLPGGIVLGLLGYVAALVGCATLLRIGVLARIPALAPAQAGAVAAEAPRAAVGRQNTGLVLLSVGLGFILTACALEGYVFALLVHMTSA